ncbi:hypothetical protein LTR37_015681 [Vermiconidia calcicola]|uniref:Uncharacterized protein n=1 Tax=Vermiconidia calcicola TaxID=1690605 RepID=A0ACC3MQ61_9PEZI|nr:hypothetical protein LTR37_015681 [Vermiconidia calcicola]
MYDQYLDAFEEILVLCTYIMNNDDADRRLFSVSLDEGLLNPLWFVVTHCRDGRMRHQALDSMQRLPAHEGIWHVEALTRAAQLCVAYEERGKIRGQEYVSHDQIPEHGRVHCSGFDGQDISSPKHALKVHMRVRPNGMDGEWEEVEETILVSTNPV